MQTLSTTFVSLSLVVAVALSGAHAKEITSLSFASHPSTKKLVGDDASNVKIHHDPHTHIDKQTLKTAMHLNDGQQTDNRSLRLLEQRSLTSYVARISLNWRALLKNLFRADFA
jgi:hypothetical protein